MTDMKVKQRMGVGGSHYTKMAVVSCACVVGIVIFLAILPGSDLPDRPAGDNNLCHNGIESSFAHSENKPVFIKGGRFVMGSNRHRPEERSEHEVTVADFLIDRYEVTNSQFTAFVEATAYVTVAERQPRAEDYPGADPDILVPGSAVFVAPTDFSGGGNILSWWQYVPGANWRHPSGSDSTIEGLENHPVVHIAWEDAQAYAGWLGRELPTETQWEYAARGGTGDNTNYAWGDKMRPDGHWMANTWQGLFPFQNSTEDGYRATAPVGCFPPNDYGLYDMIGNVWELTSDTYRAGHTGATANAGATTSSTEYVLKGGSFLCSPNFCARYRPPARQPQEADTGTSHAGFRTVVNIGSASK